MLRTLLAVIAASFCWYAVVGTPVSVQSAITLALQATGLVRESPQSLTAEYLIAMRTLGIGEVLDPADPLISQLRGLLDGMSTKCTEDRFALAAALIAGHDALAQRGINESAVAILGRADSALSDETRRAWPVSCTEVINRIVATRTSTR